jgi:outer membrane lipoprotein-sorting protein
MKAGIITFLLFLLPYATAAQLSEMIDFDKLLERSIKSYEGVKDYTCLFHKRELVDGKLREEQNIILKFKKPEHFYLKWTKGRNKGIESIFVKGKNNDKLIVHLGGLLSFIKLSIDPIGKLALKNNRHPIMEAGFGHIIHLVEKNYLISRNDKDSFITYEGEKVLSGQKTLLIKAVFPKGKGYYGHIIYVYFDKISFLPIGVTVYGWENEFLEDYRFENIKLNVGLTEKDFNPNNSE